MTMNASSATAATANAISVVLAPQPDSPPWISANVRLPAASVKVVAPAQSSRSLWPRDSTSTRWVMTTATAAIGRLTRKIARQSKASISSPPRIGAIAAAAPVTAPQTPKATPRSRPR